MCEMPDFGLFNSFFASAMNGNKNFMENTYRATQQQMLDFAIRRLHRTEEALEDCKACKDVMALATVQQKWCAETMKDYFEQSAKFGERMRQSASEGITLAN